MKESRVSDGATLRRSRLMKMFRFIEATDGATEKDIQSYMLMHYGLKFRTTTEYISEAHLAGAITLSQDGRWIITDGYRAYLEQ